MYGWKKDIETNGLVIKVLPKSMKVAPPEVLKSTRCACKGKTNF